MASSPIFRAQVIRGTFIVRNLTPDDYRAAKNPQVVSFGSRAIMVAMGEFRA